MPVEPAPFFTAGQRRLIGFATALFALFALVGMGTAALMLLARLAGFFSDVIWPLAVAGILALILRPLVERLEKRLRGRRLLAVILLYALFLLLLGGALLLILPPLIAQILDLIASAPGLWAQAQLYAQTHYPEWMRLARRQMEIPLVRQLADSLAVEARTLLAHALPTLRAAGAGVFNLFHAVTNLAIIPIYLFFFLLSRGEPTRRLPEQLPFLSASHRDDVVFLAREFIAIVTAFFRGQLLIALCMGGLLALGFTLIGLKFALFIGVALGILNIVPYLGTIIGLGVALPLAFLQPGGSWTLVGLALTVFAAVQAIEGWFLTPRIMGRQTGLHPVVIIVAIFFWGAAFGGILGMMLAIPLTAFFVTAWRLVRRKYFAPAGGPGQIIPPTNP